MFGLQYMNMSVADFADKMGTTHPDEAPAFLVENPALRRQLLLQTALINASMNSIVSLETSSKDHEASERLQDLS